MAKIKMEPEIMEGLAHRVWEEKSHINKLCSRHSKGGFISHHHIGLIITSHVLQAVQLPLSCVGPTLNDSSDPEVMVFLPVNEEVRISTSLSIRQYLELYFLNESF